MSSKTNVIEAAGGLVWRESPSGKELAVIHRLRYQDWTLPKGKREKNEAWEATALREVKEETGCRALLGRFAGSVAYLVGERPKVVLFWNMRTLDECRFQPSEEVDQLHWLHYESALVKLAYSGEIDLLRNNISASEELFYSDSHGTS